jgi:hypothetical protein
MARLGRRGFALRGPLAGVDLSWADLGGKAVRDSSDILAAPAFRMSCMLADMNPTPAVAARVDAVFADLERPQHPGAARS